MDESDYIHKHYPLNWLQLLDKLVEMDQPYYQYTEVKEIAFNCGIKSNSIPKILQILHELGMLLWHSSPNLRDIVIMKPIRYFVKPATTFCKACNNGNMLTSKR